MRTIVLACVAQFLASPLRWMVPVMVMVCSAVLMGSFDGGFATSIQASSFIASVGLVWTPVAILAATLGARSAQVATSQIALSDRRSSVTHAVAVAFAVTLWLLMGWLAIWATGSWLLMRETPSGLWIMSLGGLSLSLTAATLGLALAAAQVRAWAAIAVSALAYVTLAIWSYLPHWPGSIIFSVYNVSFAVEALPSDTWLLWQLTMAGSLLVLLVLRLGAVLPLWVTVVLATSVLVIMPLAARDVGYLQPRAESMSLVCERVSSSSLCLWPDLEKARPEYESGILAAERLIGRSRMPTLLASGDFGDPTTSASQPLGRPAVRLPVTVRPDERRVVALVVAGAIRPPRSCAHVTFAGLESARPADVVANIIESAAYWDAQRSVIVPVSQERLTTWLPHVLHSMAACRSPRLP